MGQHREEPEGEVGSAGTKIQNPLRLSDGELDAAVFHHALHRLGSHFADREEKRQAFERLPPGLQRMLATTVVQMEIRNGGLHQFFWNPSGDYAPEACEAFASFGATSHSDLIKQAISIFQGERDQQQQFKADGTLEAFAEVGPAFRPERFGPPVLRSRAGRESDRTSCRSHPGAPRRVRATDLEPCYADRHELPAHPEAGSLRGTHPEEETL